MRKLYVVGLGPGGADGMTIRAREVLKASDVIVGYTVYIDLVRGHLPGKEFLSTPMRREIERCRMAFDEAAKGKTISMICSGDAGVYGMSGPMIEVGADYPEIAVEIIPGVTAALSGAAVLGAPLIHDFALISLSDLLTPWEKIEARLAAAGASDLSVVLYNPSSKRRADYLRKACDILLLHRDAGTVCGLVRNIGRDEEEYRILSLGELRDTEVDMFTTVFIGNTETKEINGRMVTPRGYRDV